MSYNYGGGNYEPQDMPSMPHDNSNPYDNAAMPSMPAPAYGGAPATYNQKSKVVAALLAFFLGGFGVHNYYLGYTNRGLGQLGVTVVYFIAMAAGAGSIEVLASLVIFVWVLVEFIFILIRKAPYDADAKGVPLR